VVQLGKNINILKHFLVPQHRILSEKEVAELLKQYNISQFQLPTIKLKDPTIKVLEGKEDDVVEIIREGPSGKYKYFRRVAK
jgi:DNA-directed RNA polymerase subunit H